MNGTGDGNIHAGTYSEKLSMVILVALGAALLLLIGGDLLLCYLGKTPPNSTAITIGAIVGIMGTALTTRPDPNKTPPSTTVNTEQANVSAGTGSPSPANVERMTVNTQEES